MLVDPHSWTLTAVSQEAVRASTQDREVEHELFLQQLETATPPCNSLDELLGELRRCRRAVGESAQTAGARVAAMPAPVLVDGSETITPKPRYQRIHDEFGEVARAALVCAMHVHVDVDDEVEAVAVVNRIRPWLPVLLALSANSPYFRNRDTGFASWRSQIWSRWPSGGPSDPFDSVADYEQVSSQIIEWGGALDRGMLYYDVRMAEHYPTVEVRVADVCTEPEDAVLVAALARALVETCARQWRAGEPAAPWRTDLLRVAGWRAARFGLAASLVDPRTQRLAPVREVFESLADQVAPALAEADDHDWVRAAFERLLARGNGATQQRRTFERTRNLEAVVRDLCDRTEESWRED